MKELSVEEKAKAYDRAVKITKDALDDGTINNNIIAHLQNIFPELKESDDERIRKKLISFFSAVKGFSTLECNYGITNKEAIAWLEKQGDANIQQRDSTWSKEDEVKLYKALSYIKDDALKEFINSLKYHKRWKPSDKQINALSDVLSLRDIKTDVLSELLKCLRKLK